MAVLFYAMQIAQARGISNTMWVNEANSTSVYPWVIRPFSYMYND